MSSPPYNLARSLSDSFTTRSPIVFSVIDFTFRVKMPALFNPKDSEERDLWMKACVAQRGEIDGEEQVDYDAESDFDEARSQDETAEDTEVRAPPHNFYNDGNFSVFLCV